MNAQIQPGTNVLTHCEALTALDVFTEANHEALIVRLEEYVRGLPKDMATPKGRDEIRSLAAKVSRTKTGLDELGKEFVADLKKQTGAVDAKRKLIRDRLDALRDEVRDPLTQFEEAEAKRVAEHEAEITKIVQAPTIAAGMNMSAADIVILKEQLEAIAGRNWQEFDERAIEAFRDTMPKICAMRDAAAQRERDAVELIELRRAAAEQAARDVAAKLEAEKAENARIAAEQEAARIAKAVEIERQRAEAAEMAAQQAAEIAEAQRLAAIEQARIDAEAAAAQAVEAERKRVADIEAARVAAALKLERSKRHRQKIHDEIAGFLMGDAGLSNDHAHRVVEAIVAGKIPHVSVTY